MAVLIGRHDVLFPRGEDSPTSLELVNNNNIDPQRRQLGAATSAVAAASQNAENNNNTQAAHQCVWETADSPPQQNADSGGSPRSASPRSSAVSGRFDMTRSPPLTVKKNPAFSKGSGIVTNGSFSSSPSSDAAQEKTQTLAGGGSLPVRRSGMFKGSGTKMGTSGVMSGGSAGANGPAGPRAGPNGTEHAGSANGRNGLWVQNGCVMLRENSKARDCANGDKLANQNRLSTYDNVQLNHQNLLQQQGHVTHTCLNSSSEDKQSVDSATWSTSSCEISLPDNSTSCRSSTTTCPEQDFYGGHYDLDGLGRDNELFQSGGGGREATDCGNSNREGSGAFSSSRGTNSSDANSEAFAVGNAGGGHSALHSLVASLKQEMHKQKAEYETRIKRYRRLMAPLL